MLDATNLYKLYKAGPLLSGLPKLAGRGASDTLSLEASSGYSRNFLVGYLLHYCRLSQQMNRQGTIPVLEALLELEPENGEIHLLLAQQHEMGDNLTEALSCYERAAALRPDKPDYSLAAVRIACMLGKRNEALTLVCSVISAYPVLAEAYFERAVIFEADENWGRALRDYEMCHRLDPQNPAYLCATASMYRHQKNYGMARRSAAKALKLDPDYAKAHEELHQLPFLEQFVGFLKPGEAEVAGKI